MDKNKPISCDTQFSCKRKIVNHVTNMDVSEEARSMNNFKCIVCTDYLYTEGFTLYGQGKDTEKSAFGDHNAVRRQVVQRWDYKYGYVKRVKDNAPRKKPKPSNCPASMKIADDSFELPCCQPVKDNGGILKIVDPTKKKDMEQPWIKKLLDNDSDLACCGGGPACCRWCPETLCDSLEKSSEALPKLWWHVCSGEDTRPSYSGYGIQKFSPDMKVQKPGEGTQAS